MKKIRYGLDHSTSKHLKMSNLKLFHCPLCKSNNNEFISSYLGSFLSCKELRQCQSCELIFAKKLPSKSELDEYYSTGLFYDKLSNPYNPEFINFSLKLSRSRLNLIFSKITFNEKLKMIDIGAGNAQLGIALTEFYDSADYEAVEPDSAIRNKYGNWVKNIYPDIIDVNITDYDIAVMNQVLEHMQDPVSFLESVYRLLKPEGYVYIDVPYKDYLYKPSIEPHILFWNPQSMSLLLDKTGFTMIFCDTAGMPHKEAKRFFNQQSIIQKARNPWLYKGKINRLMKKIGVPHIFDGFRQFEADQYGGNRQWLRCLAQKTVL